VRWPEDFYAVRDGVGCPMCAEDGPEDTGFGLRFVAGRVSNAYLQRASIQPGYTVVVWTRPHVVEPTELTASHAAAYWADVLDAGRAIETYFQPVKMNYQTLGNALPHLHTHIIPRYADDPAPGEPFPFPDRDTGVIPDDEFRATVESLRRMAARARSL
jgi:diadenosine tetraphosphate (Ap4A) HIT family hydrolase